MAPKHDTERGDHNPSDPQSTTSVDRKLVTNKDESIFFETTKNENIIGPCIYITFGLKDDNEESNCR